MAATLGHNRDPLLLLTDIFIVVGFLFRRSLGHINIGSEPLQYLHDPTVTSTVSASLSVCVCVCVLLLLCDGGTCTPWRMTMEVGLHPRDGKEVLSKYFKTFLRVVG